MRFLGDMGVSVRVMEWLRTAGHDAREKYTTTLNYFRNYVYRLAYSRSVANGWSIGSGGVKLACKTGVGQRLKLAGMRWREYSTDTVCHLRALFKSESGQWQAC